MAGKVAILGLDCVPPKLAFDVLRDELPNLCALMRQGSHGPLRSCIPPITVPAWSCMLSGRDAGELGLYGFRKRARDGYGSELASSRDLQRPRLWDRVGEAGGRSLVLFVPPSHPPAPLAGTLVSCLLTPDAEVPHTYPATLGEQLRARFGPYRMDVEGFRHKPPEHLLQELSAMTAQHFAIARMLYRRERPELFVMVEIGPDRLHHAFFDLLDPDHPDFHEDHPLRPAALEYYRGLDRELGELLGVLAPDTRVIVASDHGARPLRGAIAINEWLMARDELVLRQRVERPTQLSELPIDYRRTRAFAEGGYCARIHLNVRGRDPQGVIPESHFETERETLLSALGELRGPDGEALSHRLVVPEREFRATAGRPPDILAFFGDLDYRAVGSVGHGRVHLPGNDRGPDRCNHDWDGIFVHAGTGAAVQAAPRAHSLFDVHATALRTLGLEGEPDLLGEEMT